MKILLFHPFLKSMGGAEKLIYEYSKRSKHKIYILSWIYIKNKTFSFEAVYSILGNKLESIARSYFGRLLFLPLSLLKFPEDFDVLVISTSGISILSLLGKKINIPKLAYVHTPLRAAYPLDIIWNINYRFRQLKKYFYKSAYTIYNFLEKNAWSKLDFAVFNSYLSRKRALDKKLIDLDKTAIIYPGANLESLYYKEPENYFLYVARFNIIKRQHILIKAFAKFSKKYDYKLILVGGLENKRYFIRLLKLIKKYNLENRVKLLYNLPYQKIIELYSKALAFVHIPFMEDFGIAPLEAAAAGKYIINVYPSGNYEILKDFPGIYWIKERFYDEKMVEEVYKALEYFIKNKDELIEKGKENRKKIKELDLSWDRFAKEMDKIIETRIV